MNHQNQYDVIIIGAGPGGIFTAYELSRLRPELRIAVFEAGNPLERRKCPIDGVKVTSCMGCKTCAIMNGFGGAGAFSDGKYNITNQFGGTLHEYIGKKQAIDLMKYVDEITLSHGGQGTALYSTANSHIKKMCLQNGLHLLDASVRHLGTDINYIVLKNLYEELSAKVDENELEFLFKQRVGGEYIFYGERFANNEVNFVYLLRKHVDIGTLAFQREEIQGLCWKDAEEVLAILRRQDAREAAGEKDVYAPGSYCIWTHEFERVLEMVKRSSLSTFSLQQG